MRTAINAITFKDGKLLLVKKKDVWILPGGKPEGDESDIDCLMRECKEEIPNSIFIIKDKWKDFIGKTPNTGDLLNAKTYFAEISGDVSPSGEITESKFVSVSEAKYLKLSEITNKIVDSLIEEKIFI